MSHTHTIYMRSNTTFGTDQQEIFVHPEQIPREVGKRIAEGYGATLLAIKPNKIEPPALDHDAYMLTRFNNKVSVNGKLERRIFANLLNYLLANGFAPVLLDDTEEDTPVSDVKSAMELAFNLDECRVYFDYNGTGKPRHWIYFVMGNGIDLICDYSYSEENEDGWKSAMDSFDTEDYA